MLLKSLSLSCFRGLRTLVLLGVLTLTLTGCSATDIIGGVAGAALGGGPSVNAQVGKTNTQGLNITTEAPSVTVRPKARVDSINQNTTNVTDTSPLVMALLIIGWLAPSPSEIGRGISNLIKRKTT